MNIPTPITNSEKYISYMLGEYQNSLPTPTNRYEQYLYALATNGSGTNGNTDLSNYYTKSQTDERITEKIAEIVADAPEDFDTLKELSDWIYSHEDSAAAMNSAIADNTAAIANKVDKVPGKVLSTNDFTDADKNKLDELENYDDTYIKSEIAETEEQAALNRITLGYQKKNILPNTAVPITRSGITYTINNDGIVTANGTATTLTNFVIHTFDDEISGNGLILSGCSGGSSTTYYMDSMNLDFSQQIMNFDGDVQLWGKMKMIRIVITKGVTMNNVNFYPMIRYAEITDDTYEPYKPSVAEYIENLEARISALENNQTNE